MVSRASTGAILVGDVIAFQVYINDYVPMFMIGDIITAYKRGSGDGKRINEVLKHDDEIERGGTKVSRQRTMSL